jgi:anaerobic magnesium-protoporphyrin IX monomethyl ester cyclase
VFVYPGTEAYTWAQANGYLQTTDYSKWLKNDGDHNCVISLPGGLTAEYLTGFCENAYKRFHFNIRYLIYKTWQLIRKPSEGRRSLRSAFRYLCYMLKRRRVEC